jgi:diguanylate cyclase (GGDEF)-like protein
MGETHSPEQAHSNSPKRVRSLLLQYGLAVASVALATWVRVLLDPVLGDHTRYALVLTAVLAASAFGGGAPGLAALILGIGSTYYFVIPPRGEFGLKGGNAYEVVFYSALGTAIVVVCGFLRTSSARILRNLHQSRETLSQTEDRLNLTLRASGIATWTWDIPANRITGDDRSSALFGLPLGRFPATVEAFSTLVHPDDRERVQRDVAASIETGEEYNTEFRVVWPDGTVRTLASRAHLEHGEAGRPRQFSGLAWDVTEHHQAQENLRRANEKLKESVQELERSKAQGAVLSAMNELLQACSGSKEAYGIIGQYCAHLFPAYAGALFVLSASRNLVNSVASWNDPPGSEPEFEPDDCWALRRGQPQITEPGQIDTPCRHLKEVHGGHACLPLTAQGTGIGLLYFQRAKGAPSGEAFLPPEDRKLAHAIAESVAMSLSNLSLQDALRRQSIRDPLTGLFNRRYLEESVERELARLARREHPAGFAMLDLDHFKSFNDTFGHEGGDALLRAFGQFLREHLRKEDIPCRYGGEEFCILFSELSLEETVRRAEELRSGVSRLGVQHGGQHLGAVTVSIGVAAYPTHGSTLSDLVAAADSALYQAKADGRDRVIAATTSPTPRPVG